MSPNQSLFGLFWIALLTSTVLAAPIYRSLVRWKSHQTISQYAPEGHQVKQGTPTMGGLIIVAGALVAILAGMTLVDRGQTAVAGAGPDAVWWGPALVLLLGFAAIGFLDDYVVPRLWQGKRGLGWKQKLVMEVLVAGVASVWMWGGFTVAAGVCAFVVLFFSNAYNFSDGLDGLAGSLLVIIASTLALLDLFGRTTGPLMLALVGAAIPFLMLNAPPAKVFMGDVGSLPIGALLGAATVAIGFQYTGPEGDYWPAQNLDWSLIAALKLLSLVMVAELLPPPLQVLWVKLFKRRLFPYTPIHHAFEKAGWKETRVVAMFALVQFVLAIAALSVITFWG